MRPYTEWAIKVKNFETKKFAYCKQLRIVYLRYLWNLLFIVQTLSDLACPSPTFIWYNNIMSRIFYASRAFYGVSWHCSIVWRLMYGMTNIFNRFFVWIYYSNVLTFDLSAKWIWTKFHSLHQYYPASSFLLVFVFKGIGILTSVWIESGHLKW